MLPKEIHFQEVSSIEKYVQDKEDDSTYFYKNTVGQFLISKGRFVTYQRSAGAHKELLQITLEGPVLGILMHQRQLLSLKGSSVVWRNQGILICGNIGVGKSSLAAALCLKGASLVSDHFSSITIQKDIPYTCPMSNQIKLWEESLKVLNIPAKGLKKVRSELPRYYWPSINFQKNQYPIQKIIILSIHNQSNYRIKKLDMVNAHAALTEFLYPNNYLNNLTPLNQKNMYKLFDVVRHCEIFQISRPQLGGINSTMKKLNEILK